METKDRSSKTFDELVFSAAEPLPPFTAPKHERRESNRFLTEFRNCLEHYAFPVGVLAGAVLAGIILAGLTMLPVIPN